MTNNHSSGILLHNPNFAAEKVFDANMQNYGFLFQKNIAKRMTVMAGGDESMKEINLFIRPEKLEILKKILVDGYHCGGMTVLNSMGCGNQKGFTDEFRGVRTNVNLLPKLKVEVIVDDKDVDPIVSEVCEKIATGMVGDGKIIVKNVEDVIRIRTQERGVDAI